MDFVSSVAAAGDASRDRDCERWFFDVVGESLPLVLGNEDEVSEQGMERGLVHVSLFL
jgi:hypothetical protein